MLPVIIYPLMIPLLIAAIELTNTVLSHQPMSGQLQWIRVLVASDIGFTTLAWVLADTILLN
jgi:heme exporter protein B